MGTAEITNSGERLTVSLFGEIDHHSLKSLRGTIDAQLENYTPRLLILDFGEVSFMDSSGIGLILGRKRIAECFGGKVVVKNATGYVEKLIRLAGLSSMISKQDCQKSAKSLKSLKSQKENVKRV